MEIIATALLAIFSVPKQAFIVNFVPLIATVLIASSPISNEISYKMRVAITRTPLYYRKLVNFMVYWNVKNRRFV